MGVVNVTPDSFSDGGTFLRAEDAVAHALRMLDEGADLIDVGAESTRPGSKAGSHPGDEDLSPGTPRKDKSKPAVSAEEEQARLLPVVEGILRARPDAVISVDTYKAATALAALKAGAEIVNDVSGLTWDEGMAAACAHAKCGVVLMHTRGRPEEWGAQTRLGADDVMKTVRAGLAASLEAARRAGMDEEAIVLDPGYGFGKRLDENYALLVRQAELLELGRPLLAGLSRKSFLGWTLRELHGGVNAPVESRETASVAAMVTAILHGASMVRAHAVRPAVEAARIADAVLAAG
jgi:dihydropteroate synthase